MIKPDETNGGYCMLVVYYHHPLLIEVPQNALRDLKLRPILVYSVGDVL
jgi:hypothetical protein